MKNSPGKVSSLDQCKQSCEATRGCQSITFFRSGYCSLYSTPCTKTKRNNKAAALLSFVKQSGLAVSTTGITTSTPKVTRGTTPNSTLTKLATTTIQNGCAKEFYFVNGKCKSCPKGYTCDGTKWAVKTKKVCSKGLISTPVCFACPHGHKCANGVAKAGTWKCQPVVISKNQERILNWGNETTRNPPHTWTHRSTHEK